MGAGANGRRRLRVACEASGCGLLFEPFPKQKIPLCPYHRRTYEAEREREKKARWRDRVRAPARVYNAVAASRRSR